MNTSTRLETKVKRLTEGEYFVEDAVGGLLAKTWREDVANQIAAALNGKDIDLLNGKAGEILNAQLDELAALRAENAQLRELLTTICSKFDHETYANVKHAVLEARRALEAGNA